MKIFSLSIALFTLYISFIQAEIISISSPTAKKKLSLQDKVKLVWLKHYQKEYSTQYAIILASEYDKLRSIKLNDKKSAYFHILKIKKAKTRLHDAISKLKSTTAGRKFLADKKKDKRNIDINRYKTLLTEKARLEKRIRNAKIDIIIAKKFKEEEKSNKINNKEKNYRNRGKNNKNNRNRNNQKPKSNKDNLTTNNKWLSSGLNSKDKSEKIQQLEKKLANLLALLKANQIEIDKIKRVLKKYIAQDEQLNNLTKEAPADEVKNKIPSDYEESEGSSF